MNRYTGARRLMSHVIRYYPALTGVLFLTILCHARADVPGMGTTGITLVSSDSRALLRISCMDGNSLFISVAVPAGNITPDSITVPDTIAARWITGVPSGQSVNIVYAAAPRALLRDMLSNHSRKLTFNRREYDFGMRVLADWHHNLPAACR